jgi:hypothetical protein
MIRTDEWMVFTPYIQIAVNNDFGQFNAHSAVPRVTAHLPGAAAARLGPAVQALPLGVLRAASSERLFVLLHVHGHGLPERMGPAPAPTADAGTSRSAAPATLFFAPFVQVWWTSNAGAFALAPWAAVAWLASAIAALRIVASAYALAAWLIAVSYPPFIISSVLALAVLVLAVRRDAITLYVWSMPPSQALALAVFVGYFHDIIPIVRNTVYPGQRQSAGGGSGRPACSRTSSRT